MARLTFEERNQNNYVKYSDVSIETINKYKGVSSRPIGFEVKYKIDGREYSRVFKN